MEEVQMEADRVPTGDRLRPPNTSAAPVANPNGPTRFIRERGPARSSPREHSHCQGSCQD